MKKQEVNERVAGVEIRHEIREQEHEHVVATALLHQINAENNLEDLRGQGQRNENPLQQQPAVEVAHVVTEAGQIETSIAITANIVTERQPKHILGEDKMCREGVEGISEVASFDGMDLKDALLRGIYAYGFEKPTAIQRKAIVPLSRGRDVIGQAQAGTGKTGAFCIAALQRLDEARGVCQALILAPLTELAIQINKVITELGLFMGPLTEAESRYSEGIKSGCFYGGDGAPSEIDNKNTIDAGIHTAVGTPGRIANLVKKDFLSLQDVKMLVIDEADEMFSSKLYHDNLKYIINCAPEDCTIALFSSTMPKEVLELANECVLKNPIQFLVAQSEVAPPRVRQYYANFDRVGHKYACLEEILSTYYFDQAIIFVTSQSRAGDLFRKLSNVCESCEVIHGSKSLPEREATIRKFRCGDVKILIATDIISRGFDTASTDIVINYDVPDTNYYPQVEGTRWGRETYIHRIGRCGKSEKYGGVAVSFVASPLDDRNLRDIAHFFGCKIDPLPSNLISL